MKIVASADWRDELEFEVPAPAALVAPGGRARCFACGPDSEPRDRDDLWAVKHRHPKHPSGFVRFYCLEHRPALPTPEPERAPRVRAPRARASAPRRSVPEVPKAVCPDCFVEVAASGECGICGWRP